MSNLLASLFPFAVAGNLVLTGVIGSQLSMARRRAAMRVFLIVLAAGAAGMLLWLILEGSNSPLKSLIFVLPLPLAWALGRIFPRMRRAFVALGGGLMIAYGFMFSHLLPDIHNHTAFELFRLAMAFCGAFMIAAAWGNWLPPDEPEEEVRLRPTLGGPPRHFGKTS